MVGEYGARLAYFQMLQNLEKKKSGKQGYLRLSFTHYQTTKC